MRSQEDMRGAAAVGQLHSVPPWEALLVRQMRLWCDGPAGQAKVRRYWQGQANSVDGQDPLELFSALIQSFLTFARRPLVRHGLECECLGADEAVFAQIVADASAGNLDDAIILSGLIAMPAQAEPIALLAGRVGTSFRSTCTAPNKQVWPTAEQPRQILH